MHRDALLYDFPLVIASAVVPRKFFGKISEEGNFRIFLENSENFEKYPLPKNTRFTVDKFKGVEGCVKESVGLVLVDEDWGGGGGGGGSKVPDSLCCPNVDVGTRCLSNQENHQLMMYN